MPNTAATGLDMLDCDEAGNIYIRTLWDNSVRCLNSQESFARSTHAAISRDEGTIMACCWTRWTGLVIADHRGQLWRWDGASEPKLWTTVPVTPVAMAATEDELWVLGGAGRPSLVNVARDGVVIGDVLLNVNIEDNVSAFLLREHDILLAGFGKGRLYSLAEGRIRVVAEGFANPTSLIADGNGGVLVVNFGAGSIGRVLP